MTKMTKRDKLVAIVAVLEGVDEGALAEFAKGEIALIDKRKDAPRKATAAQLANEEFKAEIVEMLTALDEGMTATEIGTELEVSVQKATQLVKQLVDAGTVTRVEGKGKTKTTFTV